MRAMSSVGISPRSTGSANYQLMTAAYVSGSPFFPSPESSWQLWTSRVNDKSHPRTRRSLSARYWASVVSETSLQSWGKWASRQVAAGLSHAGGSQRKDEEDGRPVQRPLSQSQPPGLSHTRGHRLRSWCARSWHTQHGEVNARTMYPAPLGNWSYGQGRYACLTPTPLLLVDAAHPPCGLVELVFLLRTTRFPFNHRPQLEVLLVFCLSKTKDSIRPPRLWYPLLRAVLTPPRQSPSLGTQLWATEPRQRSPTLIVRASISVSQPTGCNRPSTGQSGGYGCWR